MICEVKFLYKISDVQLDFCVYGFYHTRTS